MNSRKKVFTAKPTSRHRLNENHRPEARELPAIRRSLYVNVRGWNRLTDVLKATRAPNIIIMSQNEITARNDMF